MGEIRCIFDQRKKQQVTKDLSCLAAEFDLDYKKRNAIPPSIDRLEEIAGRFPYLVWKCVQILFEAYGWPGESCGLFIKRHAERLK